MKQVDYASDLSVEFRPGWKRSSPPFMPNVRPRDEARHH